MTKNSLFASGVPTEPDVKALSDQWPALQDGDEIKHEEIEGVLAIKRNTCRYKTVVGAWRKRLEKSSNIILKAIPTVGYVVADPEQRVNLAVSSFCGGARRFRRAGSVASTTDTSKLPVEVQKQAAHVQSVSGMVQVQLAVQAKKLKMELSG
jgi:hypothetical protein